MTREDKWVIEKKKNKSFETISHRPLISCEYGPSTSNQ